MAEAEGGGAEDVAGGAPPVAGRTLGRRSGQGADQAVEGLGGAPVLLLLIGRQLQWDHRDRQGERLGKPARIILNQLGRAGGADDHRLRLEARVGGGDRILEDRRGVAAEILSLEGRVGNRRALGAPLDHREEQVGIGVALGGVQHVVQPLHRGGDPHGADMRRSLIGPDGELHGRYTSSRARRSSGRANNSARSPACS